MRVHVTEPLFGLEEFGRISEKSQNPAGQESVEDGTAREEEKTRQTPVPASAVDVPAEADPEALPQTGNRPSYRRLVAGMLLFLLASAAGISLFSLAMKTQRRAVSYELARQTRLFSRISKHRAVLELEYAYLRSTSPVLEEFIRQGWREVPPREVVHVTLKPSVAREAKKPW